MMEIDGLAKRMLLCPPDVKAKHVANIIDEAGIDAIVRRVVSRKHTSFNVALWLTNDRVRLRRPLDALRPAYPSRSSKMCGI